MVNDNIPEINPEDNPLVKAIEAEGGYIAKKPDAWDKTKSITDALGNQRISFFPQYPKLDWTSLIDQIFRILALKIIEDWDNARFGKSSFPLFLIDFEDGRKGTTLGSGTAILNQARALNKAKACPVKVKLIMRAPESPAGQPYYFLDGVK